MPCGRDSAASAPRTTAFIEASGRSFNTIPANDFTF
jgi:hypothetical protein